VIIIVLGRLAGFIVKVIKFPYQILEIILIIFIIIRYYFIRSYLE